MSWSTATENPIPRSQIDTETLPPPISSEPEAIAVQAEQYAQALAAAQMLAHSVGRIDDPVVVRISGHANPDHAPRDGWGAESLTVTVEAVTG